MVRQISFPLVSIFQYFKFPKLQCVSVIQQTSINECQYSDARKLELILCMWDIQGNFRLLLKISQDFSGQEVLDIHRL